MENFEPRKHHLFNIHQFRQPTQEKEESYDDFVTRLKQAAGPCDFPTDWRDARRVRRRLLSKPQRRNARESLIVVGDQVLLKQSKTDVLTPAFDL